MNNLDDFIEIDINLLYPESQVVGITIRWNPIHKNQRIILPSWAPGSYTIRDYSQYLFGFTVYQNNTKLGFSRETTNSWLFSIEKLSCLTLKYKVIASENTVRTSYIDSNLASLCLPSLIAYSEETRSKVHKLNIITKKEWNTYIPLKGHIQKEASNYDELIDCPLHSGEFISKKINVLGYEHQIIFITEPPFGISHEILKDIESICTTTCKLMNGDPPAKDSYQFIIQASEYLYGGLEHDNSCFIQYCWKKLIDRNGYRKFLQLVGHEYLHQWNIRRLRPKEFIRYNYIEPVISENLWFAEGVTSYLDIFLPYISGLSTIEDLYIDISNILTRYLNSPGRKIQSLGESSREAWVKLYKSTPSSQDTQISYYNLGALVSMSLDINLRHRCSSLSELLRFLWSDPEITEFGYSRSDILRFVGKIDQNIATKLIRWLDYPDSLDINECFSLVGLSIRKEKSNSNYQGINLKLSEDGYITTRIELDSPAMRAGLIKGDKLIAINKFIIKETDDVYNLLSKAESSTIHFSRKGKLMSVELIKDSRLNYTYNIYESQNCIDAVTSLRRSWLQVV